MKPETLKKLRPYVLLKRDPRTGIAWVEDGTSGSGHSAHPNICSSGSVRGMCSRGYWKEHERTVRSHGYIYNVDRLVVSGELDQLAAEHCQCIGCLSRRELDEEEYDRVSTAIDRLLFDWPIRWVDQHQVIKKVTLHIQRQLRQHAEKPEELTHYELLQLLSTLGFTDQRGREEVAKWLSQ